MLWVINSLINKINVESQSVIILKINFVFFFFLGKNNHSGVLHYNLNVNLQWKPINVIMDNVIRLEWPNVITLNFTITNNTIIQSRLMWSLWHEEKLIKVTEW